MTTTTGLAPADLFIGGRWRESGDAGRFDVRDPASGEVIATVANATVEDGVEAVEAAASAFKEWAAVAPRHRGEVLRRTFELMTERREQLAELITMENGKALVDARAEVTYAAEFFRWYAEEAVRLTGSVQTAPNGGGKLVVLREPVGVAVLVTPWNFPAAMATRKIGPALAAGCTVVLKPASETPLTALAIAELLGEAGVPAGVVNVVPSRRSGPIVEAMVNHPTVGKLSFTGSTEVGRTLLKLAADTVVNCSMELGGNAPFLVLEDADLEAAVDGAMVAKMRNGGEACTAANRFYVHESLADEFVVRFARRMEELRVGPGLHPSTDLGPLISESAREEVHALVESAISDGADLQTGGELIAGDGYFYPPTVLDNVPPNAKVLSQEIFGPVAPIVRFDDVAEAVQMANSSEYGLVAYVYTRDLQRGLGVAERLQFGMVGLNRGVVSDPAAPFGGVKQSGIGREGGHDGILEYTESKYVATQW